MQEKRVVVSSYGCYEKQHHHQTTVEKYSNRENSSLLLCEGDVRCLCMVLSMKKRGRGSTVAAGGK